MITEKTIQLAIRLTADGGPPHFYRVCSWLSSQEGLWLVWDVEQVKEYFQTHALPYSTLREGILSSNGSREDLGRGKAHAFDEYYPGERDVLAHEKSTRTRARIGYHKRSKS